MPVLGRGGTLELRRELPPALVFSPAAVRGHVRAVDASEDGYWTGDQVFVWGPRGLPFDLNGDGRPDLIGGVGMFFGSKLGLFGPRAARLVSGGSKWFGPERPFQTPAIDGQFDRAVLFISRDSLDRISFYRTFDEALESDPLARLEIFPVDFRLMLLAPVGATGYQDRLEPTFPELRRFRFPAGESERRLEQVSSRQEPEPVGEASDRPWYFLAEMTDWSLELQASEIDTTGMGEKFGDATRALITGGGELNFFINRQWHNEEVDSSYIARLMILLSRGCKAEAFFTLARKAVDGPYRAGDQRAAMGNLGYKAEIFLARNVVNTRAEELIRGTSRFVTIGRVKLKID